MRNAKPVSSPVFPADSKIARSTSRNGGGSCWVRAPRRALEDNRHRRQRRSWRTGRPCLLLPSHLQLSHIMAARLQRQCTKVMPFHGYRIQSPLHSNIACVVEVRCVPRTCLYPCFPHSNSNGMYAIHYAHIEILTVECDADGRTGKSSYQNQFCSVPSHRSYTGVSDVSHTTPSSSILTSSLFDPERPEQPNTLLMGQLIQDFFSNLSSHFPFLSYEEIAQKFLTHTLSSLMANCIAALAVRWAFSLPILVDSS